MMGWFRLSRPVRTVAAAILVSVSVPGQAQCSERGRMRAIIIGIDEYRDINSLKGATADARGLTGLSTAP